MPISSPVKMLGDYVVMPLAVAIGGWMTLRGVHLLHDNIATVEKIVDWCIARLNGGDQEQAASRLTVIVVVAGCALTTIVLPRLLPFTQVSYGVLPHFKWEWIESRLAH
jgi:hypothetical protein